MVSGIFSQFIVCLEMLHFLKIGSKSGGKRVVTINTLLQNSGKEYQESFWSFLNFFKLKNK